MISALDLLRPTGVGPFDSPDRSGLLWALETIAWNPEYLLRVARILARLSEVPIDDNWGNKAVEIDPRCAHAYACMAEVYAYSVFTLWPLDEDPIPLARMNIERALAVGESDSYVHAIASHVYIICGDHDLAWSHADRAVAINPNDISARHAYGTILTYSGEPEKAGSELPDIS